MYGRIAKLRTQPGKREELLELLLGATGHLPGCLNYIIARDPADSNAVWVTEVWEDNASHKASLALAEVQAAIAKARPLVVGVDFQVETEPAGGFGLPGP